ncbi:MAG: U32 family peptidase [Bacilli bacterium]|nr:U32 family peptidase [Bacilli bacterium]
MKLLVECSQKEQLYLDSIDGIILPLEGFSVESVLSFSMDEIKRIKRESHCEVFVKLNKNFMNEDIEDLKNILIELDQLKIDGVFFYDLAVLQIKKEMHLMLPLIWNQTHMVNNMKTCNYYHSKGVEYALVGKEITLEEIHEILEGTSMKIMVEVVSRPSVAFSKRSLITNYYHDLQKEGGNSLTVTEGVSNRSFRLLENEDGTSFFLDTITNGVGVIQDLYRWKTSYIVMREYGMESFFGELVHDTKDYIQKNCEDSSYVLKYQKLGDYTNFFFQKTIYRVKKNG